MRVIAGTARSLPLKTPKGKDTRPTTDRIKETLFNMLQPHIPDSVFVDLFSGSGGIGIEALSRGCRKAYFADNSPEAAGCILDNLKFTHFEEKAVVLKQDAPSALDHIFETETDIIFMDPPYGKGLEQAALAKLAEKKYVTPNTIIVVESSLDTDFSYLDTLGFELLKEKRYKTNRHLFLRKY